MNMKVVCLRPILPETPPFHKIVLRAISEFRAVIVTLTWFQGILFPPTKRWGGGSGPDQGRDVHGEQKPMQATG